MPGFHDNFNYELNPECSIDDSNFTPAEKEWIEHTANSNFELLKEGDVKLWMYVQSRVAQLLRQHRYDQTKRFHRLLDEDGLCK